jgi:hypothetical protein
MFRTISVLTILSDVQVTDLDSIAGAIGAAELYGKSLTLFHDASVGGSRILLCSASNLSFV